MGGLVTFFEAVAVVTTCCGKQLAAEVDWCREEESAEERLLEQLSYIAAVAFDEAALPAS